MEQKGKGMYLERENQPGTVEHYMKWQQDAGLKILREAIKENNQELQENAKARLRNRDSEYKAYKAKFFDRKTYEWTEEKSFEERAMDAFIGMLEILRDAAGEVNER